MTSSEAGPARAIAVHAVAFDMDGVLVDSRAAIEMAWRTAAGLHGLEISDEDMRTHVHGQPASATLETLFPGHTSAQREEIWRHAARIEEDSPCQAIPGVLSLLEFLRGTGIAVGLVTSNLPHRIDDVLHRLEATGAFDVVVSRQDTTNGKPHPEPYLTAARRLRTPPYRMLVFEDSLNGIRAATQAGCVCVAVCTTPPSITDGRVVATIPDFTAVAFGQDVDGTPALTGLPAGCVIRLEVTASRTG